MMRCGEKYEAWRQTTMTSICGKTARTRSKMTREEMGANAEKSRKMFLFLFSSSFWFNASVHTVAWLGSDGLGHLATACLLHLPVMSFKSFFGRAYCKEKK